MKSIDFEETTLNASGSGLSWGAILGGATVTTALGLLLVALGAGFGLAVISPWNGAGLSATRVGVIELVWLVFADVIACAIGGYLAGRLRVGWAPLAKDEIHFRDTAQGFVSWAIAVVITAALLARAAGAMTGAPTERPLPGLLSDSSGSAYLADQLLHVGSGAPAVIDLDLRSQVERAITHASATNTNQNSDIQFLTQLVVGRGIQNGESARRIVDGVLNQAREAADQLRKAVERLLLWTFLALLTGAFSSSLAATIGGRQRDHVIAISR